MHHPNNLRGLCLGAALLAMATGCSLLRPHPRVSVEAEPPLPRALQRELILLASVEDVLEDEGVNEELLRLATRSDERNMTAYLRAQGFFDASVTSELIERKNRPHARFAIQPGPAYQIAAPELVWPDDHTGPRPVPTNRLNRAASSSILAARGSVVRALRETGYPDAHIARQTVVVDHATRLVHPTFEINPGPPVRMGGLKADGLRTVRDSYIQKARTWKPGEPYDIRKVELLERRLAASGIFSSIRVERDSVQRDQSSLRYALACAEPDLGDGEERYDVRLRLRERRPRMIQLGVGYRTDTGGEVSAQWQHRNLFGRGENLIIRGRLSEEGHEEEMRLIIPFFLRSDQQWGTSVKYRDEKPDAYTTRALEGETWLAREVSRHWFVRSGVALHYLDERQSEVSEYFLLLSLPQHILLNRSNNRLDATRGYRVLFQTDPYQGLKDPGLFFWKNLATASGFLSLRKDEALSLAARLTGGSISGASLTDIPAEARFYAGGGQSVRGYAYQSLSPRDADGRIVGGMSLLESSLELRGRIRESFGLVAFLDGGVAYEDRFVDFTETYRWGAGAGFRYFTPVGPLRFDVGMPLDRRKGIDKDWQFYISIGQAF